MAVFRGRGGGPSAQNAYWSTYGSAWSLTGSLLGSTLVYLGLFLLLAAASAFATLATGLAADRARMGDVLLLPYIAVVFLLSMAMARSVGHIGRQVVLGAIMMVVIGPFLGLILGYGLAVDPAAVSSALLAVGGSLVVTTVIAYLSPWDLSRLSGLAMVGLLGLLVTQGLAMFLTPVMGLVTSPAWFFIGILVFELYMVVDLARLRSQAPYGPNDSLAVYLGLGLALDVINLFMYFLELFLMGGRRR
jgi:FtsH-binding integral membrane protein